MDDSIGKILNYLDEAGLRENTMIFFTSDNGLANKLYQNNMLSQFLQYLVGIQHYLCTNKHL